MTCKDTVRTDIHYVTFVYDVDSNDVIMSVVTMCALKVSGNIRTADLLDPRIIQRIRLGFELELGFCPHQHLHFNPLYTSRRPAGRILHVACFELRSSYYLVLIYTLAVEDILLVSVKAFMDHGAAATIVAK